MNLLNCKNDEKEEKKDGDEGMLQRVLKTRAIVLAEEIDKDLAKKTITQLLLMEAENAEEPIKIIINSPGGDADAGFAIFDMIRFIKPPVKIICAGITASAAVIILLAAQKSNRYSLPNARFLIHQPSTGVRGAAADIEIEASEILKFRKRINDLIATETGQSLETVEDHTKRNYWLSAEQAVHYGLVSKVITTSDDL